MAPPRARGPLRTPWNRLQPAPPPATAALQVPSGSGAGDIVEFRVGGQRLAAIVPDGLRPGDTFEVDVGGVDAQTNRGTRTQGEGTLESMSHPSFEVRANCDLDAAGAVGTPATEQYYTIVVPDGVKPGDSIEGLSTGGASFVVEVPPGVHSGMELSVCVIDEMRMTRQAEAPVRICDAEELRVPSARPGKRFYEGQHVCMARSGGGFSYGVVLEVVDAIPTLYR